MMRILLLFCTYLFVMPAGLAEVTASNGSVETISAEAQAARDDIVKVLEGPDFNREVTKRKWRFKNTKDLKEDEEIPEWLIRFVEFLEKILPSDSDDDKESANIGVIIAKVLEFMLWIGVIAIVVFLLYHYRGYLKTLTRTFGQEKQQQTSKPEVMFGMDVRQESLPENVPQQVMALWREGSARESLGLLYRATLSGLIHQYDFSLTESATENECADIVKRSNMGEIYSYFKMLTVNWQRLAYGHRMPEESDVMTLCEQWPGLFANEN